MGKNSEIERVYVVHSMHGLLQGNHDDSILGLSFLKVLCNDGGIRQKQLIKDGRTKVVYNQWPNHRSHCLGYVSSASATIMHRITI